MTSIGGEDDGSVRDGSGFGLELAVEEFVEAAERGGGLGEIGGIEAVLGDERVDAGSGFRGGHAFSIPFGEDCALDEGVEGEFSERISINPAKRALAVDFFGFGLSCVTVEVSDAFHAGMKRLGEF